MSHKYAERPKEPNQERVCITHRHETMIYHALKYIWSFLQKNCAHSPTQFRCYTYIFKLGMVYVKLCSQCWAGTEYSIEMNGKANTEFKWSLCKDRILSVPPY